MRHYGIQRPDGKPTLVGAPLLKRSSCASQRFAESLLSFSANDLQGSTVVQLLQKFSWLHLALRSQSHGPGAMESTKPPPTHRLDRR